LRKIAAFVLCMLLVLTLGFTFIHPAFLMLANWLGPVLGTSLLTAFSMLYLLLGDPLKFVALTALWGGVALLGGIIIRRRVGAVLTMLLIFAMLIPVLAVSVYDTAMIVSDLTETIGEGNPMDFLPPLPTGLTLAHLYEAPLIGSLMEAAIGMFQAGRPPSDIQRLFYTMLTPILIGVTEKLVIIVFASLIGVEIGKMIEPSLRPTSESIRASLGGKPRASTEEMTTLKENLGTLGIILIIITSSLLADPYALAEGDGGFYSENIMGFADSRGRGYVGDLFIESGTQLEGVATEGLLAGVILSQEGVTEVLLGLMGMDMEGLESFANMIPPTVMVTVYIDVPPEIAGQRSEAVSQAFSSAYGVDLHQIMALEPPTPIGDEIELPPISIVLYQSTGDLRDLSEIYLDQFLDNGGLAELIEEASANGRLVPGATPDSADGSVLLSGFVNVDLLLEYMPEEVMENITAFIPKEISGLLGFAGGVSYWDRGVESEELGLDLLGLLGVEEVGFSDDSDMSLILLAAPNGTDIGGETGAPNVKITTSLPLDDPKTEFIYEMLTDLGLLTLTAPGESIDPSSFQISVSGVTLPLNIEVSKSVSPQVASPDDVVKVTVTVNNHDTEAMEDVTLDDSSALQGYSLSTRLVSGTTSEHWSEIGPGQSRSMSYTVELGQGGVYSLYPANVAYTHEEVGFSEASDWAEVSVAQPSAFAMGIGSIFNTGETLAEILDMATGGNGGIVLMGATAIVVLILAVLEFLNFRKWIGGQ